jgi:hypothetical protein
MHATPRRTLLKPRLLSLSALLVLGLSPLASPALAAQSGVTPYPEADLALGRKLIEEHKCSECHARRVGGDGNAIYRPLGRVNTPSALRGMVEMCNTQLGLSLFPEEVMSMAAVLDRDHYRFTPSLKPGAPQQAR